MKACECGNQEFSGHQVTRSDVRVDQDGDWLSSGEVYDSEDPYGPFHCTRCEKEYEDVMDIPDHPTWVDVPCHGIILDLEPQAETGGQNRRGYDGGSIVASDLKEKCPHCEKQSCVGHCQEIREIFNKETSAIRVTDIKEEIRKRNLFNAVMDGFESIILSHAVAGIDVTSPAYLEGLETAIQAVGDEIGD